jgi:hypothetical protein
MILRVAGDDLGQRLLMHRKMRMLRDELSGPGVEPIERILIERIVICWYAAYEADLFFERNAAAINSLECDYYERRRDGTRKRFLSAVKALADVRRKALPILQINTNQTVTVKPHRKKRSPGKAKAGSRSATAATAAPGKRPAGRNRIADLLGTN